MYFKFRRQSFDNCSESAARALSERLCHADPASARHDIHSVRYLQRGAVQVSLDLVAIIFQSWDWEDLSGQEVAMVLLNQHMDQAGSTFNSSSKTSDTNEAPLCTSMKLYRVTHLLAEKVMLHQFRPIPRLS